ncbi:MAG: asparagine synthase (glutamine-hydrolyzing) [Acidobacteria bacterium]|nr:asparagine synthase (glutamine-hydrolyzing) [Acidobacteriota bacterium]MBP7475959.1 asparagine synthase (glutamine-hydrolyzing) [Pyrinomonadaceae bacterium]
MCGITGWVNLEKSKSNNHTEAVLHSMCERILHRGPDSEGLWMDDTVALGMRRLSIIDLHTGDQPVYSEDKSVVAMINGELYNYREVRADLEKRGHKFRTQTDVEIVPHLYQIYGDDLVDHINGMFAISLWDTAKKKLILARDRFGEKPIYYGVFDGKLLYASEPKAILAHPSVKAELNLDALRHYLSYDYVPAPHSIYKGIFKLPAAHILTVENGEIKTRRYWNVSWEKSEKPASLNNAAAELRELMSDAVRMRLVADVPLGILLSGGVDSSAIAAFAVQHATEKVKTFSIGFEEDSFDESKYARQVSHHLGTEHYEATLSVGTAADLITEIGTWLDEPLSDGSLIPTFMLSRFVRHHVTVALGGDGGDELFAGYPMYFGHKVAEMYSAVPGFIRSGMIEPVVKNLPVSTKNLSFEYRAKRFVRSSNYDLITRHHSWFGSFSIEEQTALLTPEVREQTSNDIYRGAREMLEQCDATNEIEQMQYLDMNFYMAEDILTKVDRASMAVSLETRAPFLDPRIGQFAASVPLDYKLRGSKGKYILKKSLEGLLPDEILHRKKKGFGIPIAEWLKGRLSPLMHDLLAPERLKEQGLFNAEYVQILIAEHEKGIASHHKQLWTLLVFQLWYDNFLK